jgi:hypothetical protein
VETGRSFAIAEALKANRADFHALVESMSAEDIERPSLNPGWTNREVLFHATFGFVLVPTLFWLIRGFDRLPRSYSRTLANVLNFSTPVFNVVNAAGARIGGRLISPAHLERLYDWAHPQILRRLSRLGESELQSGMYYPSRWDGLFHDYMTLDQLLTYPLDHYRFHLSQLSR